ncbi:MAG: KH domain-containing protein [Actinobacteria bacterium]|nr:KH domain-containing protein [Actinomycetota bacterium]
MKYFVYSENEEQLKEILEGMDLNIDEVEIDEAPIDIASSFGKEAGFLVSERAPERAARFTKRILYMMGMKAKVKAVESEDTINIEIDGEDLGNLIGSQGRTLEALQIILNAVLNKNAVQKKHIYVDAGGYKKRKLESLKKVVQEAINKAKKEGKPVALDPMSAYERKIVHEIVSGIDGVRSESQGEEPNRNVIVYPE